MKHKNRIEILGSYYLRIRIGKFVFDSPDFYQTKSSAMRAAKSISAQLILPIYDYNGHYNINGYTQCSKKEFKIIESKNCMFKRNKCGQLKSFLEYQDVCAGRYELGL